jgi:beta-N-acetylhexosaminidase
VARDDSCLSLVVLGFDGHELPTEVADLLSRGLGGVALFKRNLRDVEQVRDLCRAIRVAAGTCLPPIISIDQEGGRVQRLRGLIQDYPAMGEVGAAGHDHAQRIGARIGRDLADLGFNVDFAPVLDVDSNPDNPIIGDRSFSADSGIVSACGTAFLRGLDETGVTGCGKHFPGHGDASADSHLDLPVIAAERAIIEQRELVPFRAAIDSGIRLVMTAHCLFPALDPVHPATLSHSIITGILRDRMGYQRCVITDDLGMKAIADRYSTHDVLRLGLQAGVDLFLHCGAEGEGLDLARGLMSGLGDGSLSGSDARAAIGRVQALRAGLW